jgi:Spondin_N
MRRFGVAALAVLAAALFVLSTALATPRHRHGVHASGSSAGTKVWQVTIENLTPPGPGAPGSQPLSPPLFVVHSAKVIVWRNGQIATHVVAAIAEDASNAPAVSAYTGFPGVETVFTGAGGPIPSGGSHTYTVRTRGEFDRVSLVTMLVNTNDGFTGLDSLRFRGREHTLNVIAYDSGSEKDNQLKGFIPGPCCGHPFVRDPEGAPIHPHAGIKPHVGDLDPAIYGWTGPVAKITIRRMS